MLGLSLSTFTLLHVLLSLAGIATGFVVLFGMMGGKRLDRWADIFLVTTVLTSVTGFGFPADRILPSHIIGIISLFVLTIAILARYVFGLAGGFRKTWVITATIALYLNVFVAVVQSFLKIPALKSAAPTQTEPPFAVTQLAVLGLFVLFGIRAVRGFRDRSDTEVNLAAHRTAGAG